MEQWREELYLKHYGVKGMKWRHKKGSTVETGAAAAGGDFAEGLEDWDAKLADKINKRPFVERTSKGIMIYDTDNMVSALNRHYAKRVVDKALTKNIKNFRFKRFKSNVKKTIDSILNGPKKRGAWKLPGGSHNL